MAKRKINNKKIKKMSILIIVVLILIVGTIITVKIFTDKQTPKETVKVIDTVKDYTLDENETNYYKDLFTELKEVLSSETIDEEKYAKIVSQLFLSDFFTLKNKVNKMT